MATLTAPQSDPMGVVRKVLAERKAANKAASEAIPVSVLSGFLGAGKTTMLKHILENRAGLRVGVIVNDMAALNVDAHVIAEQGTLVQAEEEKVVELSNGCICCTLREDLFVAIAKLAIRPLDYILIESSGISEPLPVAETFTFKDASGTSLSDVACLDTLVTVVDGASFLHELYAADSLRDRGWEASEEDDERTVAQLFCDQLEFANVIVMNKMDLMDDAGRAKLQALLRRFNPTAKVIECEWGRVNPKHLLGTGLFDMAKAEEHPDWLKEARIGEHLPESVEYGISSLTFRSRRPFNVARFEELTTIMESRTELLRVKCEDGEEGPAVLTKKVGGDIKAAALRVIRAKGLVWLGNRQRHWQQGMASLAGRSFTIAFGAPWAAAVELAGNCDEVRNLNEATGTRQGWGDRRIELVVIGQDMDHAAMTAALRACLVTDAEMASYAESYRNTEPVFPSYVRRMPGDTKEDLAERIKRYNIEVVLPQKKNTQVLKSKPRSIDVLSAHSCIAEFEGSIASSSSGATSDASETSTETRTMARFRIDRYLRYAHLFPELASGLVKVFEFPLASADEQTSILAEETDGLALSNAIAGLVAGDRVELEWRQCRVEMDTDEDDRFHIIEQCNKLVKVDTAMEAELLKAFPQPQIMINRNGVAGRGDQRSSERKETSDANRGKGNGESNGKSKSSKKSKKSKKSKNKKKGKKGSRHRP